MYSVINETDSATTVNLSVAGSFLPSGGRQLVTVGAKHLRIFRLNPFVNENGEKGCTTKLDCIYSTDLMAPVRSLAVARWVNFAFDRVFV